MNSLTTETVTIDKDMLNSLYTCFWLRNEPDAPIDERVCIIFQAMKGDSIDTELGPFVVMFAHPDLVEMFREDGYDELVHTLNEEYAPTEFREVSMEGISPELREVYGDPIWNPESDEEFFNEDDYEE